MFSINISRPAALLLVLLALLNTRCLALHNHTHIGVNEDKITGTADDDKLWFFSMPGTEGWPDWGNAVEMVPTGNYRTDGKQDYVCEILYCWHTAHPDNGSWQLPGSSDSEVLPEWQIELKRVSFDDGFFILNGRDPVLTYDGSSFDLSSNIEWMEDKYNNNGELGSWGFHCHLYFHAWANGEGEIFNARFQAIDSGSTNLTIALKSNMIKGEIITSAEAIQNEEDCECLYDLTYILPIVEVKNIFTDIRVGFGLESPIIIKGDNEYLKMVYILAPRVE